MSAESDRLAYRFRVAGAKAINLAAEDLLARSMPRVPLDIGGLRDSAGRRRRRGAPGDLRDSGHIAKEADPYDLEAWVAYSTVYAAAQHEGEMSYIRGGRVVKWVVMNYTTPGTGRKYLEEPLKEMGPRYEAFIAKAMGRDLRW